MDRLGDSFRVVYFDQRGSGRSSLGEADGLSLARSVADLVALLDGLDLAQASVLGHSIGGNLAMLFAAAHPNRVTSLILAMPGPPFDRHGMAWVELESAMAALRTTGDDEELAHILQTDGFKRRDPAGVEAYIRNLYRPFFVDRAIAATIPYRLSEHGAATAVEQESMLFGNLDTAAALASLSGIGCPALVLSAELDPIPSSFAARLVEAIPAGTHRHLDSAGHFAFLEAPDEFFEAVVGFLAASH
jgi:pimeloyl-ACP methyl ester carboxylesterase